jgi:hypothetical protein
MGVRIMRMIHIVRLLAFMILGLLSLVVLLLTLCVLFPSAAGRVALSLLCLNKGEMMVGDKCFLGIVEGGQFRPLSPATAGPIRLTGIAMQEARSPESGELALAEHEGRVITVRGRDGGGWIYSARVVYRAGPFLTAVLRWVLRVGVQLNTPTV